MREWSLICNGVVLDTISTDTREEARKKFEEDHNLNGCDILEYKPPKTKPLIYIPPGTKREEEKGPEQLPLRFHFTEDKVPEPEQLSLFKLPAVK